MPRPESPTTLSHHQMVGSMGRVGSADDNAAMESFFALLQRNVLDRRRWNSRDELRIAIGIRIPKVSDELWGIPQARPVGEPDHIGVHGSCPSKTPPQQAGGAYQQRSWGSALR